MSAAKAAGQPAGRRVGRLLKREVAPAFRQTRLLLAGKTALATGLAWAVGPLIPGTIDEYSYYAPLGALVSMTPTLMGAIRTSAQTAAALTLGVALAWAVILLGEPAVFSVPLAVGIGVILAGLPILGPGRDYVPIAALFVLVIGGGHAGEYSLGYVVQMAVGMVIGVAVNLLVFPPLYIQDAARRISSLRGDTERRLAAIAAAVRDHRLGDEDWRPELEALSGHLEAARQTVDDAWESRRGNPRSRWHRYDMQEDYDDLRALRRISYHLLDMGEALSDDRSTDPLQNAVRPQLASALDAAAALVRAWDERENEPDAAAAAARELDRMIAAFEAQQLAVDHPSEALGTVVFSLRRVIALADARLRSRRGSTD